MLQTLILFVVGFVLLIKGADILIRGASSVARLFSVSEWVIGVVVVGIGTSIPEMSVMFASVFNGTDVGVATIIGSNIFNILFILGAVAVIAPIHMKKEWVIADIPINIAVVVGVAVLAFFPILGEANFAGITQPEGMILLAGFAIWIFYMLHRKKTAGEKPHNGKAFTIAVSFVMIAGGIAGVFLGGRWVVAGAETLAHFFNVGESVIGLTIVGIGTSISELIVSITAVWKGRGALAVGNIIGSNIFDLVGIFGIATLFTHIPVSVTLAKDVAVAAFVLFIVLGAFYIAKPYVLERRYGVFMILLYLLYIGGVVF